MKLGFRPAELDERRCLCGGAFDDDQRCSFVVALWSSSYKKSHRAGLIQAEDWASVMHQQIEKLLAKPNNTTLLAYEKTDPSFLYGFIAGDVTEDVPIVHYVYCKEPYRKSGVARGLFDALGVDPYKRFVYTCETSVVLRLKQLKPELRSAQFNNNEARYPKEARRRPYE